MTKLAVERDPGEMEFRQTAATQLLRANDQQIDQYIDTNVTDLASAKDFLKQLTRITRDTVRFLANKREAR